MTSDWPCPVYRLQGPPGTGKTYTLTNKWIPRASQLHGEDSVLVCSLTRAAAAEIGGRSNLPPQNVSTLHAFAYRAMSKPPLAQDKDNVKMWNSQVHDEWRITGTTKPGKNSDLDFTSGPATTGDKLLDEVTVRRNKLIPVSEWERSYRTFYEEWRAWKREKNFMDFTDLIWSPVEFDIEPPGETKVIICDEAQDFTYLDINLIKHWAKWCEMVVMAGDRCQALFTWIGANPKAFIPDDLPDSEITTLGQSYRVPEAVREYATRWIDQDTEVRHFPYAARKDEDGNTVMGVVARKPGLNLGNCTHLIDEIESKTAKGNRVMVLASCRYLLTKLCGALRRRGVPFHNPYRIKEGAWNPMRGGPDRLAGFLRPFRIEVGSSEMWTWEELKRWTEPLRAKGTLRSGAVTEIKARVKRNAEAPTISEVRAIMVPEAYDAMMAAFRDDDVNLILDWYEHRLLRSFDKMMEMGLAVTRNMGAAALVQEPKVVIGSYHCSPPDEPVLTIDHGYVAIGDLDPKEHTLVGYNQTSRKLYGRGDKRAHLGECTFTKGVSRFDGSLIVMETDVSRCRVTPEHRVVVRYSEAFYDKKCVYLMRRGRYYRIGSCCTDSLTYKSGNISTRLSTEKAEDAWILSVHDTRMEALLEEQRLQTLYGIPWATFEVSRARVATSEDMMNLHESFVHVVPGRAEQLLYDYGMDPDMPMFSRPKNGSKRVFRSKVFFECRACNVLKNGMMEVPVVRDGKVPFGSTELPETNIVRVSLEPYKGDVVSLSVDPYEHYVSGGQVVHNSVKGGDADIVYLAPDLGVEAAKEWYKISEPEGRNSIVRTFYVGLTRARKAVALMGPVSKNRVEWL